ncbi:MAG: histidinol phosphate phosphatase domain-containing protein, partial [Elusimicrobia bacterium]|nr:histidinol phosphate phosphatase domain-containing protein [Elusimicrobiota bacterium]MBD3412476.1 histidinol phosphate phosphatase domain-containing protein [Elusimicrobiota bacterium]
LSYIPPRLIQKAVKLARKLGAQIVLVHGESPVEPVPPGTNHAALLSNIDVLAHPGFITVQDVKLAKKNNILLEITSRKGHAKGNPHVAKKARATGCPLAFNTDTHMPENLIDRPGIKKVLSAAHLSFKDFVIMQDHARSLVNKIKKNRR